MAKGAVLNNAFIDALGLSDHLLTLKAPILSKAHETLLEPMFHILTEEVEETIYLERQYLYDSQISIRPSYGAGEQILIWTYRASRHRNNNPDEQASDVLLASDLFLLNDAHEFLRFRQFLKSQRILDAQARDFLAKHHLKFSELASTPGGMQRILACLAHIQEWPDPENGFKRRAGEEQSLDGLAKRYSDALIAVRDSSLMAEHLLQMAPDERLQVFRIMSYAEDRAKGPDSIIAFMRDIAAATGDQKIIRRANHITNGRELAQALESIRRYLVDPKAKKPRIANN